MNLIPQFIRSRFAASEAAEVKLPDETAWSESSMYKGADFPKYAPDDLLSRKGYAIYRKMMVDEQVKAVVRFKRDAITSRDYIFELDDTDFSEEEALLRKAVFEKAVGNMGASFTDALNGVMSAMYNGFSITEKMLGLFDYDGRSWYGVANLKLRPHDTFLFHTDVYGNVVKFVQQFDSREQELDLDSFIHYVQNPDFDVHYGRSELRECYRAWFSKDMVIKFQNIHLERFAAGFVWAAPKEGKTIVVGTPEYNSLKQVMQNLQATSSIILPSGIELNIEHPATTDAFERAIAQHDKAIAKALLVPNLLGISEQGSTGSFAQSKTQLEAFLWTLDADATRLEQTLNVQLFKELGDLNFGDGKYPRFKFKPISDERKLEVVKIWQSLVTAGAVQATDVDEAFIRDALEMPKKTVIEGDAPDLILNGAQVTSLVGIIASVGKGEMSPEAGKALITAVFPIDEKQAEVMVASAKVEKPAPVVDPNAPPALGPDGKPLAEKLPPTGEPNADLEDETIVGKMGITVSAMSRAMKRVDFAVIGNKADNSSRDNAYELAVINSAAVARLVALAEELKLGTAEGNPDDIQKIVYSAGEMSALKKAATAGLQEAWAIGESHAKKEVSKAKFGRNFWNEDQPRDENGRFGEGGGGGASSKGEESVGDVFKNPEQKFPSGYIEMPEPREMRTTLVNLVPTQATVDGAAVDAYMKGEGGFQGDPIEVVYNGSKYLITDGHHRAAAAIKQNKPNVKIRIMGVTDASLLTDPRINPAKKFGRNFWNEEDHPRDDDGKFGDGGGGKGGNDKVNKILAKLSTLPSVNHMGEPDANGKYINNTITYAGDGLADAAFTQAASGHEAPYLVYLTDPYLQTAQPVLNRAQLEETIKNFDLKKATSSYDKPVVARIKDKGIIKLVVIDGNHRMAAAKLLGLGPIEVVGVTSKKGAAYATNDLALQDVAAKYIKQKGYVLAGDISNATKKTIRNILMEGVKVSKTAAETKRAIYKALEADGMLTEEAVQEALGTTTVKSTNARIETAIRTTSFEAINEARYQLFSDPELGGFVEALEYSAVLDDRTTEICSQLDSETFGIDSEVWSTFRPPNHFNCRSLLVPVTVRDTWTEGDPPVAGPQKGFGFNRTCKHKGHNHA